MNYKAGSHYWMHSVAWIIHLDKRQDSSIKFVNTIWQSSNPMLYEWGYVSW